MATPFYKRWINHRRLLVIEAALCFGALEMAVENWLMAQADVPDPVKVLIVMLMIAGFFGILYLALHEFIQQSLAKAHQAVQRSALPSPVLLVHLLVFAALFMVYSLVLELPWWAG